MFVEEINDAIKTGNAKKLDGLVQSAEFSSDFLTAFNVHTLLVNFKLQHKVKISLSDCLRTLETCLVHGFPVNSTFRDFSYPNALTYAAKHGMVEIVRRLLLFGANANFRERDGNTPLHLSGTQGHSEVVLALIEQGADPGKKNNAGVSAAEATCTSLIYAFENNLPRQGLLECFRILARNFPMSEVYTDFQDMKINELALELGLLEVIS